MRIKVMRGSFKFNAIFADKCRRCRSGRKFSGRRKRDQMLLGMRKCFVCSVSATQQYARINKKRIDLTLRQPYYAQAICKLPGFCGGDIHKNKREGAGRLYLPTPSMNCGKDVVTCPVRRCAALSCRYRWFRYVRRPEMRTPYSYINPPFSFPFSIIAPIIVRFLLL